MFSIFPLRGRENHEFLDSCTTEFKLGVAQWSKGIWNLSCLSTAREKYEEHVLY